MGPTKMSKDWKDYWILSIKIGLDSTQQKTAIGVTKTFRKSFNIQFMAVTWTYWFSLQLIFSGQVGQWIWGKLVNGFVYNAPRAFGGGNSGAGDTKIIFSILLLWCSGVTIGVLEDTGMIIERWWVQSNEVFQITQSEAWAGQKYFLVKTQHSMVKKAHNHCKTDKCHRSSSFVQGQHDSTFYNCVIVIPSFLRSFFF